MPTIGQYDQGDGTRQVYDFMMGFTGDRGSLTAGAEYSKEDPVWARDRWFSEVRFPTGEKSAPRPGWHLGHQPVRPFHLRHRPRRCRRRRDLLWPAHAQPERGRPGSRQLRQLPCASASATDNSNPNQASTVYSGIERRSLFLNGHYDITDNIAFRHRRAVHRPRLVRTRTPAIRCRAPRSTCPRAVCRSTATSTRWATRPPVRCRPAWRRRRSSTSVVAGKCRAKCTTA